MTIEVPDEGVEQEFEDVIDEMIRLGIAKMHVGCWGKVESYTVATQKCSVRPIVRASLKGGGTVRFPVLTNVPVRFPAGAGFSMTWPIKAGDQVWLDFADRSIDEWCNSSDPTDITPQSKRRFHISDAVAYPGGRPGAKPLKRATATDLVIGQDDYGGAITNTPPRVDPLQLVIGPTGIGIGDGGTTNELLNIVDTLISELNTASVGGAPIVFVDPGLVALIARLDKIRRT